MRIPPVRAAFILALVVSLAATGAIAQPLPVENHYKVYNSTPIAITHPVGLSDQFGTLQLDQLTFDRVGTPATKILPDGTVYPMLMDINMDWYRITYPEPVRTALVTDQFGKAPWTIGDASYLLVPALKILWDPLGSSPGSLPASGATIPTWNHYLCYDALAGPLIGTPVTVVDLYGNVQVVVLKPLFFCNPVEKHADGQVYPIIDSSAHLACYLVENPSTALHMITAIDQFQSRVTQFSQNDCLCVPALKEFPLATRESTWGHIKALFKN